jgi:molybdopterin molybdotransferase
MTCPQITLAPGPDQHLSVALELVSPVPVIEVAIAKTTGLVLARDVRAPGFLPAFDNAAMDGYAVRRADLTGAGSLPVVADIPAGPSWPEPLPRGAAAPIMTGAPLPRGADTVVPVELTEPDSLGVRFLVSPGRGDHVRRQGGEHCPGDLLCPHGTQLRAVEVGLLAASGVACVPVHRPPRVAVLGTGTELVAPGQPRPAGGVHDANTALLTSLLRACGADATTLPPPPDDPHVLLAMAQQAVAHHDLLVTAGGISAGTHEVVRQALSDHGVDFTRVAMSPGGPQGLGVLDGTPVIALPGNPSAALVSFAVFVRPMVRALAGLPDPGAGWILTRTAAFVPRKADRVRFAPAVLEERDGRTVAFEIGSAHRLSGFAGADAVMRIEPGIDDLGAGSTVPALRI